jgi:hypothetical protein
MFKKKSYLVSMRHSCGTCGNVYRTRTAIGAIVKAYLQYRHLGVRMNTITSINEIAE